MREAPVIGLGFIGAADRISDGALEQQVGNLDEAHPPKSPSIRGTVELAS